MLKYAVVTVTILAALAGCNKKDFKTQREESYQRWNRTRAHIAYGVAEEHLKVGQLTEARAKLAEAIALDGEFHEARLMLGKVYIEQGSYALAEMEIAKVQQAQPANPQAAYLMGVALEKQNKLQAALEQYQLAHSMDQTKVSAIVAAGEVLVKLDRVEAAAELVESNIHLAGADAAMYELAGRLAMMSKRYDKAASYYQHACDQTGGNVKYRESLARAHFLAGDDSACEQAIQVLLDDAKYKPQAWVLVMMGDSLMNQGKAFQARDAYTRATEINGNSARTWISLAKAHLALDDAPRTVLAAQRALGLETGNAEAAMLLGFAQMKNAQPNKAVATLRQAIVANQDNSMLHTLLGQALAATGDSDSARQCYRKAIELDPSNEAARRLLSAADARQVSSTR